MTCIKLYQVVDPDVPIRRNPHALQEEVMAAFQDQLIGHPGHPTVKGFVKSLR
jgi:hypothetical protein